VESKGPCSIKSIRFKQNKGGKQVGQVVVTEVCEYLLPTDIFLHLLVTWSYQKQAQSL